MIPQLNSFLMRNRVKASRNGAEEPKKKPNSKSPTVGPNWVKENDGVRITPNCK
jgi:hypothetical protein